MKKHVLASAVLAAITVPSLAQNVTVYGVLDTGYTDISRKRADIPDAGKDGFVFNNHSSSRIGLRGTEDLGGGMKASFVLETGISNNARDGLERNIGNVNGNAQGNGATLDATILGSRGAYAELSFGQGTDLRVGFSTTPVRDVALAYDAAFASNNVGSTLVNDANFGSNRRTGAFLTHTLGAIKINAGMTRNNDSDTTAANADEKASGYLIGASYNAGPLSLGFAQLKEEGLNAARNQGDRVSSTAGVTGVLGTDVAAFDGTRKYMVAGGSYNLGAAQLFASYGSVTVVNDTAANAVGEGLYSTSSFGVRVPVGATTFFGQYSDGKNKQATTAGTAENRNTTGYTVGLQHNLSRRTQAYAVIGKTELSSGVAATSSETVIKQTSVGIVHSF